MVKKVVHGLEGCRKSTKEFEKGLSVATVNNPIIYSFKSYDLMLEQRRNWCERYGLDERDFAVCGIAQNYEKALAAYTNPEKPYVIPSGASFVLCTQACLQRNAHVERFYPRKDYARIVVDEFDFLNGIVPTLDYQMSHIVDNRQREIAKLNLARWVLDNYTVEDYQRVTNPHAYGKFFVANWIESSKADITFLTSEVLATRLLELIGFEKEYVESPDYSDCVINVWSTPLLDRNFFKVFNDELVWNKLEYDAIITDSVASYFEKNLDTLEITTISHMGARGSNAWINKNLLTILTHIPPTALSQIHDVFGAFGDDIDQQTVNKLFYRDRFCQAVGRTVGNRGGKFTDLWVHSSIMEGLKNTELPYTLCESLTPNIENIDELLLKVTKLKAGKKEQQKTKLKDLRVKSYGQLDNLFKHEDDNVLEVTEVKQYLQENNIVGVSGKGIIPVSKVVKYFNVDIKNVRFGKDVRRCVIGLALTNEV